MIRSVLLLLSTTSSVFAWVNKEVTTWELPWFHPPIEWIAENQVSSLMISVCNAMLQPQVCGRRKSNRLTCFYFAQIGFTGYHPSLDDKSTFQAWIEENTNKRHRFFDDTSVYPYTVRFE
jgi:hypothetical protein